MTERSIITLSKQAPLVLGSGSPRRQRLLTEWGVKFQRLVPQTDEVRNSDEEPYPYAERLARQKALAVADIAPDNSVVIGCDTIVVLDGSVLEKPHDEQDAFDILSKLSGQCHTVCSAVALKAPRVAPVSGYELTEVKFHTVSADQIRKYIETGEPMDKAGAYGIQRKGGFLVDTTRGNLDNVIGLPGKLLDELAGRILREHYT